MNIKGNEEMLKSIDPKDYKGPKIYVRYTFQTPEMKKMGANSFGCTYLRSVPFVTKINTVDGMGDVMEAIKCKLDLDPNTAVIIDWIYLLEE